MERFLNYQKDKLKYTSNVFESNTQDDYTEEQLLEVRKQYLNDYKLKEDEYINDKHELVCRKCKNLRIFQKNNFVVGVLCECQSKERDEKEKADREFRIQQNKMLNLKKLKDMSLLGERYKNASFDKLDLNRPDDFKTAVKRCKTYCEKWQEVKKNGLGIYLYGDVGTGKSLLTACIGNYLLDKMVSVLFTNFFEIAKHIKQTFNYNNSETEEQFINRLTDVDLLIIDDIGTEILVKNGEKTWLQDKIYDVINARYVEQKPTIFSSNESLTELVEKCGLMKKTVDRIASMSTARIKLQGSSYRNTESKKTNLIF